MSRAMREKIRAAFSPGQYNWQYSVGIFLNIDIIDKVKKNRR